MTLTAVSLFSGVGGLDLGLHRAGIRPVLLCEADAWKRTVLAHHWPGVPIHDDVRTLDDPPAADLVHGGFPCQDVSSAGKRAGLAGARTGLFWHALRVVDAIRPRCVLLENVPGLLSSNAGRDFATILDALADSGYGVAWRVLDAARFGVPQRRRRLYIVGFAGSDPALTARRSSAVLPDPTGSAGPARPRPHDLPHPPARRADGSRSRPRVIHADACLLDVDCDCGAPDRVYTYAVSPAFGQGAKLEAREITTAPAITSVTYARQTDRGVRIIDGPRVRRLTPTECERLMGWPDGWTAPGETGQVDTLLGPRTVIDPEHIDAARYAACGDGVVAPVAEWIGHRLAEALQTEASP